MKTSQHNAIWGIALASLCTFASYSYEAAADARVHLQKSVTTGRADCSAGTVETVTVGLDSQMRYCYRITNNSTSNEDLYNIRIVEGRGTAAVGDDVTIRFNAIEGLSDLDGDGRADDLPAGGVATSKLISIMRRAGTYRGPAFVYGDNFSGGTTTVTARNNATIIVRGDKHRSMILRKTVVEASQKCPGSVETGAIFSGDSVKYCYKVENVGDFDIEDLRVVDNHGIPGSGTTDITMTGLQDIDGDADALDLMPGAIATGELIQPINQAEGAVVAARATARSANLVEHAFTKVRVAKGSSASCQVEMTTSAQTADCPGASNYEVTGANAKFCYRVTNTGGSELSNVVVRDDGHANPIVTNIASLAAGETSSWIARANAAFTGRHDDHVSVATATDTFGNAVACTGHGASAVKVGDSAPPSPDVFVDKKISLNGICTVAENNGELPTLYDEVTVPKGTRIWYCYKMRNNLDVKWPYDNGAIPEGGLTDPQFPGVQLYHFKLNIWANAELTARAGPIIANETLQTTATLRVTTMNPNVFLHDAATVRVEEGNLRLTKRNQTETVDMRQLNRIVYDLAVDNTNNALMRQVKIVDTLSPYARFISAPGCNYNPNNHKISCSLGNMAGGSGEVRTITLASRLRYGFVGGTACVQSVSTETTDVDNCSTQTTRVHSGSSRNNTYWKNNEAAMNQCLIANNDSLNVGFTVLRDEQVDNQIDAYQLPITASSRVGDRGNQKDTGLGLALGLLNADESKRKGGVVRSGHESACLSAAKELAVATCNIKLMGVSNVINLGSMRTIVRTNCRHSANATVRKNNIKRLVNARVRLKGFNEGGMAVPVGQVSAANPLTLPADDPTDRVD